MITRDSGKFLTVNLIVMQTTCAQLFRYLSRNRYSLVLICVMNLILSSDLFMSDALQLYRKLEIYGSYYDGKDERFLVNYSNDYKLWSNYCIWPYSDRGNYIFNCCIRCSNYMNHVNAAIIIWKCSQVQQLYEFGNYMVKYGISQWTSAYISMPWVHECCPSEYDKRLDDFTVVEEK